VLLFVSVSPAREPPFDERHALTERFEAMRIEEAAKASAASPRVRLQMLLSSLPPPQQMPAPTEGMQSVLVEDSLPPEPVAAVQIATPVQVEEEGAPARVAKPSGGQIGPRKKHGEATRKSMRPAAAEPLPKRSCMRHAKTDAEPKDDRTRDVGIRAATAANAKLAKRTYDEEYRAKNRRYTDEQFELEAKEEKDVMTVVYGECAADVVEMMDIREQDVRIANASNTQSHGGKEKVSAHDDNTARALAALLRTLAAGKEITDAVTQAIRQCFNTTPAGASFISEPTSLVLRSEDDSIIDLTSLVLRSEDDSIIDLTVVIPTVEMVESALRLCPTPSRRRASSPGRSKMPGCCSLSLPPALGRLRAAGSARRHRRRSARSPAVAQFTA
jgi:hypothetical protein